MGQGSVSLAPTSLSAVKMDWRGWTTTLVEGDDGIPTCTYRVAFRMLKLVPVSKYVC